MLSIRAIVLYCAIVFAAAWALQIGAIVTVHDLQRDAATPWLLGAMAVPGLTALLFVAFHKPARKTFLWAPTWRTALVAPVAILVPTAIAFATVALGEAMGWGHSGWFSFSPEGVTVSGGPWVLGRGAQGWGLFAANVAATAGVFSAMNGVVAAGEELGWRAFLQQHLTARLGPVRGIVLLGLIWSFWHLPGLLAGYNFPDYPLLGAFVLSPLELVAVSLFMGWLTLASRSFIPAALAHGAGNSIQEGVTANLHMTASRLPEDLTTLGLTALVGLAAWAALAGGRRAMAAQPA